MTVYVKFMQHGMHDTTASRITRKMEAPKMIKYSEHAVQIAPMLAVTDYDFRHFIRGITRKAELWTEMVVDTTILRASDATLSRVLRSDPTEDPLVLQIGSGSPELAELACRKATAFSELPFREINLNVGCPSTKVAGRGEFGASLMRSPARVASIVRAMHRGLAGTDVRVSVKTRIGVDRLDTRAYLRHFVDQVHKEGGCKRFIIHARKAWLRGVDPSRNRTLPDLKWERAIEIAKLFPDLDISLNGGVKSLDEIEVLLNRQWKPNPEARHFQPEYVAKLNAVKIASRISSANSEDSEYEKESNGEEFSNREYSNKSENDDSAAPPNESSDLSEHSDCSDDAARAFAPPERKSSEIMTEDVSFSSLINVDFLDDIVAEQKSDRQPRTSRRQYRNACRNSSTGREFEHLPPDDLPYKDVVALVNDTEAASINGVMVGRAASNDPCFLAATDSRFYRIPDPATARSPRTIVEYYLDHLDRSYGTGIEENKSTFQVLKPVFGLLTGRRGGRQFRQYLDKRIQMNRNLLVHNPTYLEITPGTVLREVLDYIDDTFPGTLDVPTNAVVDTFDLPLSIY